MKFEQTFRTLQDGRRLTATTPIAQRKETEEERTNRLSTPTELTLSFEKEDGERSQPVYEETLVGKAFPR